MRIEIVEKIKFLFDYEKHQKVQFNLLWIPLNEVSAERFSSRKYQIKSGLPIREIGEKRANPQQCSGFFLLSSSYNFGENYLLGNLLQIEMSKIIGN